MKEENFVKECLSTQGFLVKKIQETDEQTPDFFVQDKSNSYLIEVKNKIDDLEKKQEWESDLNRGLVVSESIELKRRNRISGIIKSAVNQLDSINTSVDFKVIWFQLSGRNPEADLEIIKATIYGLAQIADLDTFKTKPCFYFGLNDFYNFMSSLDAVVVSTDLKGILFLNDLSPKYDSFRKSMMVSCFQPGVVDPAVEIENNRAMVVRDNNVNRKDKKAVLNHLRKKYNKSKLIDMAKDHFSASFIS